MVDHDQLDETFAEGEANVTDSALGFAVLMHLMIAVFYLTSGLVAPTHAVLPIWPSGSDSPT